MTFNGSILYSIVVHHVKVGELMEKTNVMRILDKAERTYRTASYGYDESDLGGLHAAEAIGMPPEQVFKTLVTRGADGGFYVFCIPVCSELDLKKAARAAGVKSIEMLPVAQLLPTTGYLRGGCSPIGMKKAYPTWLDETALLWDEIAVSAGKRGCQVILPPESLMEQIRAGEADLTV